MSCPEWKVKRFLDRCAYLLLRNNPGDTLTDYKEMAIGRKEIDVSSCPAEIEESLYANGVTLLDPEVTDEAFERMLAELDEKLGSKLPKQKTLHKETRFERIERIKKQYPCCTFSFCPVDTENVFEYDGNEYRIDDSAKQYQPRGKTGELIYDMDRVMVVTDTDGALHFCDQLANPIDDDDIYVI